MPFCAVRTCGESGRFACKKSEGQIISFHRFPSDPRIKAKWIWATDQRETTPSWQPRKGSTICSKHFKREDFLTCTDLKISAVPMSEEERELIDGFMKDKKRDFVDNSDTDSADDIIQLPQHNQIKTNKELTEEEEPIEYELASTTSPHDQSESNQPIAVQDSEPEFSETSSEIEFTELNSSEAKSGQLSIDAIENPQESDEQPAYGMKISKAYSTRKRRIVEIKDQVKTNIKMYRIDPATNTVRPVTSITKDSFNIDPTKPPVIITQNRDRSGKPIFLIKKSAESVDGDSQKNKANQKSSSQVQYTNSTTKTIEPVTGSNTNGLITLMTHSEEQKKVYSTPVPKLAQINQELPAKNIIEKIWKSTKLNPTMETVEKHRNLKLKSVIKKTTPPAYNNVSTAPDGCCIWPQLTLWKPKPTVSRLAPAVVKPTKSVATPADSMPSSTVSTLTSTVSTPTPIDTTPTPADSTPTPADSTPTPAGSTPTPADSTPTPADSTPTPADSTPTPADSTPTPADSTPTPADSMPLPADSTPTTADSIRTPADSMPISAVLSPAVQKLDDSNIHALDEYDTFAKHVATQLRQLSLESYLSAQGEIQSTLSRYRLCDLKLTKANPNL